MSLYQRLRHWLGRLHPYSRFAFRLSIYIMLCLYIVAVFALWLAPHATNYFRAMAVYHGALEAAPATLAAGFCAGLLCDMMHKSRDPQKLDGDDEDR